MHVEMISDENKKALQKAILQRTILTVLLLILAAAVYIFLFNYFMEANDKSINSEASLRFLSIMCTILFAIIFIVPQIAKIRKDKKYLEGRLAFETILINQDGIENEFYKDNVLEKEVLTWNELIRMEEMNYNVEFLIGKNLIVRHIRVSDGKMHEWISQVPKNISVPKQLKYMKKLSKSLPDGGRSKGITLEYSDDLVLEIKKYWTGKDKE